MLKRINVFILLICIFFLCGCDFPILDDMPSGEPPYQIELDHFIEYYPDYASKYIMTLDPNVKLDSTVHCSYLPIEIKGTLDNVKVRESERYDGAIFGEEVNDYINKFIKAIDNGLIGEFDYNFEWFTYDSEDEIQYELDGLFLVGIANQFRVDCYDYETKESFQLTVIEKESLLLECINNMEYKQFLVVSGGERYSQNGIYERTPSNLYSKWNKFSLETIDGETYINSNRTKPSVKMGEAEYRIIDKYYYYKLSDFERVVSEFHDEEN